jgi:predicted phosphodiesterase
VRLAILSDIHGNHVALKAVLSDLRRRTVDQILCLGDVAATGPQPCEVIELLRTLNWPCVIGNADEGLLRNVQNQTEETQMSDEDRRRLAELDEWTRKQLTQSHRDYLSSFKPTIAFSPENGTCFLCYHGSPRSNREGIFATTPDDKLAKYLQGHEADIFVGGHTHMQMLRRFRSSTMVNPGSVGLPFDAHPPWAGPIRNPTRAEYAIVGFASKSFSFEFLSVPYPKADLEKAVRNSSLPNADWWLLDWY